MTAKFLLCLLAAIALTSAGSAAAQSADEIACPKRELPDTTRLVVVISDLHMGLGRAAPSEPWHPTEDFRWDAALRGFLDRLSLCGRDRVDLVVAGDFLELWQPPSNIACKGRDADLGCTLAEMVEITRAVLRGHPETFSILRRFAGRGENRIHLIPGNHDSTLLLAPVWTLVSDALGAAPDRVRLVSDGVWVSEDQRVVVEHGHQIGGDANRYDQWPRITRVVDGEEYVIRPWGERFVQQLFNKEEATYPVIDNLSPEAAGARYRMADRGLWKSAGDIARFIAFNLFETSISQKGQILGPEAQVRWDTDVGRSLGHLLFANSLPASDPFRLALLDNSPDAAAVRIEMDRRARDRDALPDSEVLLLCDQIAIRNVPDARQCRVAELGALAEKTFVPRSRVMADHLRMRLDGKYRRMRVFIYGHTHLLEEEWKVDVSDALSIRVLNSGAFQRVVDEPGYLARMKQKGWTPAEGLRRLSPEDLAPCYTAVLVPYEGTDPKPRTLQWHQHEDSTGRFVFPGVQECK
jgi:UDP-2,3-diacylglucosamine pyrophosphatase LpxH